MVVLSVVRWGPAVHDSELLCDGPDVAEGFLHCVQLLVHTAVLDAQRAHSLQLPGPSQPELGFQCLHLS